MSLCNFDSIKIFGLMLLIGPFSFGQQQMRATVENGEPVFENPVSVDGKTPSAIFRYSRHGESTNLIILAGAPAEIAAGRMEKPKDVAKLPLLMFENLRFLVNVGKIRTAALYPIRPLPGIEVTALHALQNSTLEKPATEDHRVWGVLNSKTNQLMDIAIMASAQTAADSLVAQLKIVTNSQTSISSGYADHLNEVDTAGELTLTRSSFNITSQNENYVFFKNEKDSMVGSASSGAVIYNSQTNQPHSIVICASQVYLNKAQSEIVVRALRLDSIKDHRLIELHQADIDNFKKLPCENHNGRAGGGA
jgi:hypothetical protein